MYYSPGSFNNAANVSEKAEQTRLALKVITALKESEEQAHEKNYYLLTPFQVVRLPLHIS